MEKKEIKEKLDKAINKLFEKDLYLLQNDLSERCIAHKLALHLQTEFESFGYDIDCEYNKNLIEPKSISSLRTRLKEIGLLSKKEKASDKIIFERKVLPDIIVHKRGNNEDNLLVIEIKKTTNKKKKEREYDYFKLEQYTSSELNYKYGVFIEFETKKGCKTGNTQQWYENGLSIKE